MAGAESALDLYDREWSQGGRVTLAGVDEAGRGCWAGPVVAGAVILPADGGPAGLDDSKRLSAGKREQLFEEIRASALSWGACAVSSVEIDQTDILRATLSAMARSVGGLGMAPDLVLVDGRQVPDLSCEGRAVIRGDATSAAIAAASIVAKVLRDRIMTVWDRHYPGYGFAAHKGYGAAAHQEALRTLGPCPIHRFSYKPVADLDQGRLF